MSTRTYWRVCPAFWSDERVCGLHGKEPWTDDTKMLALYLLTCEHRSLEGLFKLPKGYITEDLRWSAKRLAKPFAQLLDEGFIEYDDNARLCLIVNALEYQAPENPNQITAGIKFLADLPESPLFARLFQQAERFHKPFAERLRERLPERLAEGYGKPQLNSTLTQEDMSSTLDLSPVENIFAHWQKRMGHPKATLDEKRKAAVKRALKHLSEEECLLAVEGCAITPHNMGRNDAGVRYDDLTLIFRDASHWERFLSTARRVGKKVKEEERPPPEPEEGVPMPDEVKRIFESFKDVDKARAGG